MGPEAEVLLHTIETPWADRLMKRLLVLLQLSCALLFLLWAFREIGWEDLKRTLPAVSVAAGVTILSFRLFVYALLGLRLRTLLGGSIPTLLGVASSILCIGCNNILPARLGELCKIGYLRGKTACTAPVLLGAVAMERGMDVFCLLGLALSFGVSMLPVHPVWGLAGIWMLAIAGWIVLWKTDLVAACCRVILPRFLQHWVEEMLVFLGSIRRTGGLYGMAVLSISIWGCNFIHTELLVNMLFTLNLSIQQVGMLCVVLFGSSALFLIPGGYGLMEGAVTGLLLFWGVEKAQALTVALWGRLYYSLVPLVLSAAIVACSSSVSFRQPMHE